MNELLIFNVTLTYIYYIYNYIRCIHELCMLIYIQKMKILSIYTVYSTVCMYIVAAFAVPLPLLMAWWR